MVGSFWLLACMVSLFLANRSAQDAATASRVISADFADADIASLDPIVADFDSAAARLSDPWLAPVALVPWVGRQLNTSRALADGGSQSVEAAIIALEAIDLASADDPVSAIGAASNALTNAKLTLDQIDVPPAKWLIGPISEARREFVEGLDDIRDELNRYEALAAGLSALATGESRYLIAAANTSEMGSGSGMLLQYGTMLVDDGAVVVSDFLSVHDLGRPSSVDVSDEIRLLWAANDPGHLWQYTSHLTSRASEIARISADMWESDQGQRIDGVMIIDPVAMQLLLEAAGIESIEVGGSILEVTQISQFFARDQYSEFDDVSVERRSAIAPVASAALLALFNADSEARSLVAGLFRAFDSRHLSLWSRDQDLQSDWTAAMASGDPAANSIKVAVVNTGANKLDQFLDIDVYVEVESQPNLRIRIDITNSAPIDEVGYVLGARRPGYYSGHLVINVPSASLSVDTSGTTDLNASANDGDTHSYIHILQLEIGESASYTVDIELADWMDVVQIEPSGRFPGIEWFVDGAPRADIRSEIDVVDLLAR